MSTLKEIRYTCASRCYNLNIANDLLPAGLTSPIRCKNRATADYYENLYSVSISDIRKAGDVIDNLNKQLIEKHDIKYYLTKNAPETFKELKKQDIKNLPILESSSDDCIYRTRSMNANFRAIHDYYHITLDKDFSYEGESYVIIAHYLELLKYIKTLSLNDREFLIVRKVFLSDTIGQVAYYYKNKAFVDNQIKFVFNQVNTKNLSEMGTLFKLKGE